MTTSPESDQPSRLKEALLVGFVGAFALTSLVAIRAVFPLRGATDDVLATQYPTIIGPLITLVVIAVLQSIVGMLVRTAWIVAIEAIVVAIGMVVIVGPSPLVLLVAVLFIGVAMWAWKSTQVRLSKQKKVGIRWATKTAISLLAWSVVLLATATYYSEYARGIDADDVRIPQSATLIAEKYAASLLDGLSPGVSLSTTTGELAQQYNDSLPGDLPAELDEILREQHRIPSEAELKRIEQENPSLANDSRFQQLKEDQAAMSDDQQITEFYRFLLETGETKPETTVLDGTVQFGNSQLQGALQPYTFYIPLLITLLYFLALRFFATIARLLFVPMIAGILWLLRSAGFYSIEKRQEEVDVITVN